jgi:Lrp/AsnC family transcriptional regulator, leucine-responsive regulatory protein
MKLNNIDIRILQELQRDADQTNLALAEKVGLSPPACLKRVQKLKVAGVIDRIIAIVSTTSFRRRLNMVVEVEMKQDKPVLYQQFIDLMAKAPEVKQCYQVTGVVDFVLIVNVADIFEFEAFCERTLYKHDNMQKFTTLVSVKCTKFDTTQHELNDEFTPNFNNTAPLNPEST